jgi:DNA end-binding protein Ku
MAPRAYWKGSLKLSLVSCPVLLYPAATTVDKTRFHMINKETGNRLKQQMVDAETGDVVESGQKGRGYELKKGEYVEVEKDELEAVQIESNHTIDIDSFVPKDEIDKRYINYPYYIAPDGKAGIDAFAVIRDAMKERARVALARILMRCATNTNISTTSRIRKYRKTWSSLPAISSTARPRISIRRNSRTNTRTR